MTPADLTDAELDAIEAAARDRISACIKSCAERGFTPSFQRSQDTETLRLVAELRRHRADGAVTDATRDAPEPDGLSAAELDAVAEAIFTTWHRESSKAAESYANLPSDAKEAWRVSARAAVMARRRLPAPKEGGGE